MPRTADIEASGEALFLAHLEEIKGIVRFKCSTHHLRWEEAEEFESRVNEKLIEDDYGVFRKWRRECSLLAYLSLVIGNALRDYFDYLWGKWRPSEVAIQHSPLAVRLDELTHRDGHTFDEACEILWTNHGVKASRQELRSIADLLPSHKRPRAESDEVLVDFPAPGPRPDEGPLNDERERRLRDLRRALRELIGPLPPRDRLIVMLRFADRRKVSDIARLLRVPQKPLYPKLAKLRQVLRQGLEDRGFDGGWLPEE